MPDPRDRENVVDGSYESRGHLRRMSLLKTKVDSYSGERRNEVLIESSSHNGVESSSTQGVLHTYSYNLDYSLHSSCSRFPSTILKTCEFHLRWVRPWPIDEGFVAGATPRQTIRNDELVLLLGSLGGTGGH